MLTVTLLRRSYGNAGRHFYDGVMVVPNQKNIYVVALALIAIMYGSMQGIIAVASLLATMHNPGNGMDPQ